jgi:hypothetical protein
MSKKEFKRAIRYLINHGCDDILCKECPLDAEEETPEDDLCKAITCAALYLE